MIVAHLFKLIAGMIVIVAMSVLMRADDLLVRIFVGAPLRATLGPET
jgi:hypothetical protein